MVKPVAGYGVPRDDIARVVTCSPPTLRKWLRHELDVATNEATARVPQTLHQQATTPGNIAVAICWLKARADWREKQAVDVTGKNDKSLTAKLVVVRRENEGWTAGAPRQIEGKTE